MEMNDLLGKASQQLEVQLPFVIYSKPHSHQIIGVFQPSDALYFVNDFTEAGFVFAPFSGNEIVLVPGNGSEVLSAEWYPEIPETLPEIKSNGIGTDEQTQHEKLVQQAIQAINDGHLSKVVLSRKEAVDLKNSDPVAIFKKLLSHYPSAFAYCFFHPKIGLWLGAFSERLLKMKAPHFETMAVAGTQSAHENSAVWGEKEKAEQQFVTDFIVDNLRDRATQLETSKPYTLKAGNVMHIKTDISGTLHPDSGLQELIQILHPTPAVCGLPKEVARDFILKNEGYDREYYSGFFGEFNKDFANGSTATDLYVNLRCMQISGNKAYLYIGGGITKDSVPEKEWQETVNKSLTLKRILES